MLCLPEPPSLNMMLDMAKERTRRSRTGGWMKRALPVVYDQRLEAYELEAIAALRSQGIATPARETWPRWRLVSAEFRLHQLRDWVELLASLKWPIDVLVRQGFVADDSPREMAPPCVPTQVVNRNHRGVTLVIAPDPAPAEAL
jgi:hypothetical protein